MAERRAVTRQMARRYQEGAKGEKGRMLDQLCSLTGWSRRHARRALREAGGDEVSRSEAPGRIYGEDDLPRSGGWDILDGLTGKRLTGGTGVLRGGV